MGQHLAMVNALIELGLQPRKIHCIDIPYSAQPAVVRMLQKEGIPSHNIHQHAYNHSLSYPVYQRERVARLLPRLKDAIAPSHHGSIARLRNTSVH